jgi:hypothetical protein
MLPPRLSSLVLASQSAFIKERSIHDNFRFVHASTRQLFVWKKQTILFKADISKAFDSMACSFLLELFGHLDFSKVWINWIATLLRTSSTKILLNGVPGMCIRHGHRLWQGVHCLPCFSSASRTFWLQCFRKLRNGHFSII